MFGLVYNGLFVLMSFMVRVVVLLVLGLSIWSNNIGGTATL